MSISEFPSQGMPEGINPTENNNPKGLLTNMRVWLRNTPGRIARGKIPQAYQGAKFNIIRLTHFDKL